MRRPTQERGAALVVCLILVTALGALAVAGVADVTSTLAMTRNLALDRTARSAAASGIEHALAAGPFDTTAPVDITLELEPLSDHRVIAIVRFVETTPVPSGFSIGATHDGIAAHHFEIEATAEAPRDARSALRQGFYVLGPSPGPR